MKVEFANPARTGVRHGLRAFTLPEVLISVSIVAVMFVSLYSGIAQGFAILESSRNNLRATQVMIEKLEIMRLYTWDQINSNGFIPTTFTDTLVPTTAAVAATSDSVQESSSQLTSQATSQGTTFYGTIKISDADVPSAYSNSLKQVLISVTWTNGNRVSTRDMRTFVGQNGLQQYIY